ncbi:FHA domain-containing protein [Ktedonosporobacter rubrisoli]|uniref:FHA domain-containing protein n=1 Tax=Ktedonosporobacter rubrisoli TaxID=2509675 RepID=A0A4P6JWY8_KTERU|nr:FAD-dependent oxidoreductase [Ktedonosporobacter rubrisoli]QBD80005.1 FHA domain-containing protein [Ktedonosporobacter rubrisoli]
MEERRGTKATRTISGALKRVPDYLIIGNGIAGITAAEILRAEDSAALIAVIADDPFPVYYRPALKDYLAGKIREDKLWARPRSFYQDNNILFHADRVVGIQADQHLINLRSGRQIGYQRLLLANGAHSARLNCPGLDLEGVTTLRSVADYQLIVERLKTTRRVVVCGSGTLALETAETLSHRGFQVTHLIRRRTLWSDVLDATASDLILQQERRDGVDIRLEEEISEIFGSRGEVQGVITSSGARIPCEMVLIAIGIEPNIDFARSSGISCGRGVRVDSAMRTNLPDIYAAGDILESRDAMTGRTRLLGQWYPAIQQARAAAFSMLDLLDTEQAFHAGMFYNATALYGLDFASVGLSNARDGQNLRAIIADPLPRTYRKVVLQDDVPVGLLFLGNRKEALAYKRAIDHQVNLRSVARQLFASGFNLNSWLDSQGVPGPLLGVQRKGDAVARKVAYAGGSQPGITLSKAEELTEALLVPEVEAIREYRVAETYLSQTRVTTIGRHLGAHVLIDEGSVSRRHAEIRYANGQYILQDADSTNGTFINEQRLRPNQAYILQANNIVRFGNLVKFTFALRPVSAATRKRTGSVSMAGIALQEKEKELVEQVAPGLPVQYPDGSLSLPGASSVVPPALVASFKENPALVVLAAGGQRAPRVVPLKAGRHITIGRGAENDIVLEDVVLSQRHADIFPGPDGFYVRDLGSSNGIAVNQARINNPYLLSHGDCIALGNNLLYFIDLRAKQTLTERLPSAAPVPIAKGIGTQSGPLQATGSTSQIVICTHCGVANTRIARFCASCSTPLISGALL